MAKIMFSLPLWGREREACTRYDAGESTHTHNRQRLLRFVVLWKSCSRATRRDCVAPKDGRLRKLTSHALLASYYILFTLHNCHSWEHSNTITRNGVKCVRHSANCIKIVMTNDLDWNSIMWSPNRIYM